MYVGLHGRFLTTHHQEALADSATGANEAFTCAAMSRPVG